MLQLHYWRYEDLPGADSFSHIDPSDHEGCEQAWAEVKQKLTEETGEWVPKGREIVALFEHARRCGDLTASQPAAPAARTGIRHRHRGGGKARTRFMLDRRACLVCRSAKSQ